jgi:hypothetical protein
VLEQVGLEPVAGRAYLLPFYNNRKLIINGKEEWRKVMESEWPKMVKDIGGDSDKWFQLMENSRKSCEVRR